jgi:hypothetical protein
MLIGRRAVAALALAALASLCACATRQTVSLDDTAVSAADAGTIARRVASSSISQADKDRFAAFLDAHQTDPRTYDSKTVRAIINLQRVYEAGLKMTASARREDREHRAELAKLMRVTFLSAREGDRTIDLRISIANLAKKTVRRIEMGLEADDPSGRRIGLMEIAYTAPLGAASSKIVNIPLRYVRFGEDTGAMREAAGKPKTYALTVSEIKYADGTDAGYDD